MTFIEFFSEVATVQNLRVWRVGSLVHYEVALFDMNIFVQWDEVRKGGARVRSRAIYAPNLKPQTYLEFNRSSLHHLQAGLQMTGDYYHLVWFPSEGTHAKEYWLEQFGTFAKLYRNAHTYLKPKPCGIYAY